MPTLFLSSHYSLDSRRLRKAAELLNWRVSRMDRPSAGTLASCVLPYAIFAPPGPAGEIAARIEHRLLACDDDWLSSLPEIYRRRSISLARYEDAEKYKSSMFIKPVRKGLFPADVYGTGALKRLKLSVPPHIPVCAAEPVQWTSEFRCFIANRCIADIAAYRVGKKKLTHLDDRLPVDQEENDGARCFCESLLADASVRLPAGIVIDVGHIQGRGWAVVEANEAWASSIYSCSPKAVLNSLLSCCVPLGGPG